MVYPDEGRIQDKPSGLAKKMLKNLVELIARLTEFEGTLRVVWDTTRSAIRFQTESPFGISE